MHRMILPIAIAAAAAALATGAKAAVVAGAITGGTASPGTFHILTPPFSVGNNNQNQNSKLFAWDEMQKLTLASALGVDFLVATGTAGSAGRCQKW